MSAFRRMARRLALRDDGAALAEFAMVLPLFLLLISGLYDGARLINDSLEVHAAVQAGASWARKNGWDANGVAQAVTAATPAAAAATPAPTLAVGCLEGQTVQAPDADGQCPGGQQPGGFAYISAQAPFAPRAPWPAAIWPRTVTAQAMVRVQ